MASTDLTGPNAAYVAQLLEDYRDAPASVPAEWRRIFEESERRPAGATDGAGPPGQRGSDRRRRQPRRLASPAAPAAAPGRPEPPRRRRRGDGARQGVPHARPSRCAARSARLGADGRPRARRDPARPVADARAPGADPRGPAAPLRPRRHAARGAPAAARGVHGIERLRDRAHLGPRRARLAAQGDRVRSLPRPARARAARTPAAAPGPGRGLRAVPAPVVPRPEAVLARGARRARPDARRGDRARRRGRRAPGRRRDGAPRPPQRARAHRRTLVRVDPAGVRGRALVRRARRRPGGRERRRQVPPAGVRDAGHRLGRDRGDDRAEPEPPRGRRPCRRGLDPRRADRPLAGRRASTTRPSRCPS